MRKSPVLIKCWRMKKTHWTLMDTRGVANLFIVAFDLV